jgi:hypothetical protein
MVYALTSPDSTLHYDANRLAYSPAGLVLGGFLTTALCAAAYRRWTRPEADTGFDNTTTDVTSFSEFDLGDRIAKFDTKEIFEARLPSGEQVSVTRFDPDALSVDVFNIAVEMWADLDLPGVLGVREWGTDPVPWVVTDPVDAALADCTGDLPVADLVHALADTAEVVHRAHHASTMHDALGLKNIWLVDGKVRVDGWGIARARRGESPDSDIHRLAVSIRDLLGDQQMDPEQRDELDAVLSRALVDDPDERYESLLRFADALRWTVRE